MTTRVMHHVRISDYGHEIRVEYSVTVGRSVGGPVKGPGHSDDGPSVGSAYDSGKHLDVP